MINPATGALLLQGVNMLSSLGQGYFGGKDQKKAQREADRKQAYANAINSFGGNATASPTSVQPGAMTSFLGGLGKASGIASQGLGLYSGLKSAGLKQTAAKQAIAATEKAALEEAAAKLGTASAATYAQQPNFNPMTGGVDDVPQQLAQAPAQYPTSDLETPDQARARVEAMMDKLGQAGPRYGTGESVNFDHFDNRREQLSNRAGERAQQARLDAPLEIATRAPAMPASLPEPAQALVGPPPDMGTLGAAQFSLSQQGELDRLKNTAEADARSKLDDDYRLSQTNLANAKTTELARNAPTAADIARTAASESTSLNNEIDRLAPQAVNAAAAMVPFEEFMAKNSGVSAEALESLQSTYDRTTLDAIKQEDADLFKILNEVDGKLKSDKFISTSPQVKQAMGLVANGYKQENGVGDLQMIVGMVRMGEPGLSVKEAEARAVADAAGLLEKWKVIGSGERFKAGDLMTDTQRNKLLTLSEDTYTTTQSLVNNQLERDFGAVRQEIKSVTPRMFAGRREQRMSAFENTYKLAPLELYDYTRRPDPGSAQRNPNVDALDAYRRARAMGNDRRQLKRSYDGAIR